MKALIALLVSMVSLSAFADDSCVNLNGVYRIDSITAVRITQKDCETLKVAYGEIQQTGRVDWYKSSVDALVGRENCGPQGCVTAKVVGNQIQLFSDKAWTSYSTDHGYCYFNQELLGLNDKGALVRTQDLRTCEDNYTGKFEYTLQRMN